MKECVTHHHACDCREAKFAELEAENKRLEREVKCVAQYGDSLWTENKRQWELVREAVRRWKPLEAEDERWKERAKQEADMCLELGAELANLKTLARAVAHYWDGAVTSYTEVGTIELDAIVAALQEGER